MPEDKELVPIQGELIPADVGESTEINRVFSELSEQIQKAMFGFVSQNVQEVETAARTANALYNNASTVYASAENLFLLGILKDLACLYAPLTRVTVFQIEGRFSKAFEHLAKAQAPLLSPKSTNMRSFLMPIKSRSRFTGLCFHSSPFSLRGLKRISARK
jgi:hypothetical protein